MKNKVLGFLIIGLLCLITALVQASDQVCPSPLPKQYKNVQAGEVVSAYFGNWDVYGGNHYQIDRIAAVADKLTHLVYGFMKPDEVNGTCKPHDVWADTGSYDDVQSKIGGNFAKMIELKKQFPHLKILLSIGGGTYNKNFITIAQDKDKLLKFAKSCVDMLDFYDHPYLLEGKYKRFNHLTYEGLFDGIDLDWEWAGDSLTPALSKAYTQFIQELHRLLQLRDNASGKESLLTVALQVTPKIYKSLQLTEIVKNINWFHVMAYDFYGPHNKTIGFNAPVCGAWSVYSVDGALQRIMELGVSPAKMVLGLPLYGYVYEDTDGLHAELKKTDKAKAVSYHVIKTKYLDNPAYKKTWNKNEELASLYSKKDRTFITYDGQESLVKKVEFAKNKRMQGVVLWRLSGDDTQHSMVHVIATTMKI
jgi:chitinase